MAEEEGSEKESNDTNQQDPTLIHYIKGLSRLQQAPGKDGYAYTALDLTNKSLERIDLIKQYCYIQILNLSQNKIEDFSPLSELKYLVSVNIAENAIETIPTLCNVHLKAIDLTRNQITSLKDFQSDTVANLIVTENSLQSIDGIEQLPQLTTLIASINQISVLWSRDMDQLPDLPLEHLELNANALKSLHGIERFKHLKCLHLRDNQIQDVQDVSMLRPLKFLKVLDLTGNPVSEAEAYRQNIIILLSDLSILDTIPIEKEEVLTAAILKQEREAAEVNSVTNDAE